MMTRLLYPELTYRVRGLGFQIHNVLGGGHAEADYEKALVYALERADVPFQQQPTYRVDYRGQQVGEYHPDLMLSDGIVLLELKARPKIEPVHKAQAISYLAVTDAKLGLVMNFGAPRLEVARLPNFLATRKREMTNVEIPSDVLYRDLTEHVVNGLSTVYHVLGPGFLHQVYRRAMRIELSCLHLNSDYLKELPLTYHNITLSTKPVRFFLIERSLLLATVALQHVLPEHTEKLRWAMRQTGCKQGMIANFYPMQLQVQFVSL